MNGNAIETTHKLDFECARSPYSNSHMMYRIGTVTGQWGYTADSYFIISFLNQNPGNGHLNDVFEWFEYSAKRDNKNLLILECMNERFYKHLISKRNFVKLDKTNKNCIKVFNRHLFRKLLRNGNTIIKKGSLTCI